MMPAGIAEALIASVRGGMPWIYDDGGRAAAGRKGTARDCVCRAIAIATGTPYARVYDEINLAAQRERPRAGKRSSARVGVAKPTIRRYLAGLGWEWIPTMALGSGCRVHLRSDDLPRAGRLVVAVSRHLVAVIDGVAHDTHDPSRGGSRCVYGYYMPAGDAAKIKAEKREALERSRLAAIELRKKLLDNHGAT